MKTRTITRTSAALGLVEAAHDGNGDWQAWTERLLEAAKPLFVSPMANAGLSRRREHHYQFLAGASHPIEHYEYYRDHLPSIPVAAVDPFWRFPRLVATTSTVLAPASPLSPAKELELTEEFTRITGAPDVLGLVAMVDDVSLTIGAPHTSRIELAAAEQRLLSQVTLHLETGLRLRLHPGTEIAVLRPDGRLLHAEGTVRDKPRARSQFTRHVAGVERGRTRKMRQSSAALEGWSALISGNWGLVERVDSDGKRFYAVLDTPRATRLRALTRLETEVVELSARGLTGKAVAYALGIDGPGVSQALSSGTIKLGVRSRTELIKLVAQLLGTSPVLRETERLTGAERDVLKLVRLGWQNATIAQARGRSERTVANQVGALLRKLDAPSRRALASCQLQGVE